MGPVVPMTRCPVLLSACDVAVQLSVVAENQHGNSMDTPTDRVSIARQGYANNRTIPARQVTVKRYSWAETPIE